MPGCLLNRVYPDAQRLEVEVEGVHVTAGGAFDADSWQSIGISDVVAVDSPAPPNEIGALLATVDAVAELPTAIHAGGEVE